MAGRTVVLPAPPPASGARRPARFARMGANLVPVGRDAGRLERTRPSSPLETPGVEATTVVADMASLVSVRSAAAEILDRVPRLDVIVDNAGTMLPTREVTPEGFERTFATMVLGPFVLVARPPAAPRREPRRADRRRHLRRHVHAVAAARRPRVRARRLHRGAGVRPREARPGRARPRVGTAPAQRGRRRERDAPGVGGHPGPGSVAAGLREGRRRPVAECRGGRGHHALARRRARGPLRHGTPLPRPAGPAVRPDPATRLSATARATLWDWSCS